MFTLKSLFEMPFITDLARNTCLFNHFVKLPQATFESSYMSGRLHDLLSRELSRDQ